MRDGKDDSPFGLASGFEFNVTPFRQRGEVCEERSRSIADRPMRTWFDSKFLGKCRGFCHVRCLVIELDVGLYR